MEQQNFHDIDWLIGEFSKDIAASKNSPQQVYDVISQINPNFEPNGYSEDPEADLLANIVAGIYAPVIHAFTSTIVENIKAGNLPSTLFLPPRDTIPLANSIQAQANLAGVEVVIKTPAVNRITAGIPNNQADYTPQKDPLFDKLIYQEFGDLQTPLVEVETGIYGTTTLALAHSMQELGINQPIIPLKLYGLGPNLSFVHALFTDGEHWVDDCSPEDVQAAVLGIMSFIDSLEEYGMQNEYQSVPNLVLADSGHIAPVIIKNDERSQEIARATNQAIIATADKYQNSKALSTSRSILANFNQVVAAANQGMPLSLKSAIPPMDNKQEHYAAYQAAIDAGYILRTKLQLH